MDDTAFLFAMQSPPVSSYGVQSVIGPGYADIFVFDDDQTGRLDSYRRIPYDMSNSSAVITSRSGDKTVAMVANTRMERYSWSGADCLTGVMQMYSSFDDDDPASPVMSAVENAVADDGAVIDLTLRPLLSRVEVRSVRCDFSATAFEGASLEDLDVWLSNVSILAPLFESSTATPTIETRSASDTVRTGLDIGPSAVNVGAVLFCYPNNNEEDTPGSPFTRLVLHGTLEGREQYYPIDINRGDCHIDGSLPGVGRGESYVYDLIITGEGVDNPEVSVDRRSVRLLCQVMDWEDYPQRGEEF